MRRSGAKMAIRLCSIEGCGRKHRARGLCTSHYNKSRYTNEQRHPKRPTPCVVCGTVVMRPVDRSRAHCCSVDCRTALQWGTVAVDGYDWATDAIKRARDAGCTTVERVERDVVLDRDGWVCYICGTDTKAATSPFDASSPTIDHVIPLSRGGEHTYANVRCACLHCNSSKADRPVAGAA